MKRLTFIAVLYVALMITSCSHLYHYVQVFETKSESKSIQNRGNGVLYEDDICAIYYRFWAEGGDAGFSIFNKTDKMMYVDLSKSFFIRNGVAFDYYQNRTYRQTETNTFGNQVTSASAIYGGASSTAGVSATYLGNFGNLPFTPYDPILTSTNLQKTESYGALRYSAMANSYASSTSSSVSIEERKVLAIPPHAAKIIAEYSINNQIFLFCDLDRYPKEHSSIEFGENDSPLKFSNYITFRLGDNTQDVVLTNDFYISKITNYTKPSIYKYVEKTKPCQNLTSDVSEDYKTTYPEKVYDRVLKIDSSNSFYVEYKIDSSKKLYEEKGKTYYFNVEYNGWTTRDVSSGKEKSDYQRRLLNPFSK